MLIADRDDVQVRADPDTGGVTQLLLYGRPLLAETDSAMTEIAVNDRPLRVRSEAAERRRELEAAGLGRSYSFTLHAEMEPNQSLTLPEIVLHYGRTAAEMEQFIKDYTTQRWQPVPQWNWHTTWTGLGLWEPHRNWREFWDRARRLVDGGACTGIGPYCLVHHWSRAMGGTSPYGYEPDPAMGPRRDFEAGALALKERGVPLGVWMSHSGLMAVRFHEEIAGHLRGDLSIIDDRVFFPAHYDGAPVQLPDTGDARTKLAHGVTGEVVARAADGSFAIPEPGMYVME